MNHMPTPTVRKPSESYLFRLEVTVQAPNRDTALEQLIHSLQAGCIADYRILSDVRLEGATGAKPAAPSQPETAAQAQDREPAEPKAHPAQRPPAAPAAQLPPAPQQAHPAATSSVGGELEARLQSYIDSNRLLRLHVNKGRGVKLDFPCRMLHLDPETRNLTVYHVDEKKVYVIPLNEVDEIIEAELAK